MAILNSRNGNNILIGGDGNDTLIGGAGDDTVTGGKGTDTAVLGAGNDNLFKFAFTVLVTYKLQVAWLPPALAGLAIGALFILPFLLFSATSGQLADKYDKARLIRFVKWLEIAIMLLAVFGFLTGRPEFLDIGLTYGLLNLIATLAVLKFFRHGDLAYDIEEERKP